MAYTIYIAYTADPFPQTPRPGENAGKEDVPKDGDAIFSIQSDDPVLTNGNRGDDIEQFYEVVEGPALRALSAAEVEAVLLPERKQSGLATVREAANQHIEATWPLWRQVNAEAGVYPIEEKDQKDKDVTATIQESNRVEDAIDAATTIQQVQDALDSINFPTFPVA